MHVHGTHKVHVLISVPHFRALVSSVPPTTINWIRFVTSLLRLANLSKTLYPDCLEAIKTTPPILFSSQSNCASRAVGNPALHKRGYPLLEKYQPCILLHGLPRTSSFRLQGSRADKVKNCGIRSNISVRRSQV